MLVVPTSADDHEVMLRDDAYGEDLFRIAGFTGLRLDSHDSRRSATFLAHRVARTPGDLRCHVQRINEHLKQPQAPGIYSALLDLFIALNDKGRPLRSRMLEQARPVLSPSRYRALQATLEKGVDATDVMPPATTSVLNRGFTGGRQLVRRLQQAETTTPKPRQQAREHLEYGQIELATAVLEQALLADPAQPGLHHDLLEIYQRTGDRERFELMRRRLGAGTAAAEDAWAALDATLEEA